MRGTSTSSNESMKTKTKTKQNNKKKGTITQPICQKNTDEGHSMSTCMVITLDQEKDQPGKVVNFA